MTGSKLSLTINWRLMSAGTYPFPQARLACARIPLITMRCILHDTSMAASILDRLAQISPGRNLLEMILALALCSVPGMKKSLSSPVPLIVPG